MLLATLSINPAELTLVAVVALVTVISPAPSLGTTEYNLLALVPLGVITKLAVSNKLMI